MVAQVRGMGASFAVGIGQSVFEGGKRRAVSGYL
jgi:hypothetical protein